MIKFFRQFRQNIIAENTTAYRAGKVSRYLLYAIGEILLVLIGILIALQINDQNSFRIDRQKEKKIILSVYNEMIDNENYVKNYLAEVELLIESAKKTLVHLSCPTEYLNSDTLLTYYRGLEELAPFTPKTAVLTQLVNSVQLH